MSQRNLNKPIVAEGVQIVAGLGSSVTTPGESNGLEGELVHARNTIAADWIGTRYYAVDYDGGSDENIGFSDTSMPDSGTKALKTLEELFTRLPALGQGQIGVVAIKRRAAGAGYLKKDGVTADSIPVHGFYGYFHLLIRGTETAATASSVAFANDTADKIYLGAQLVAGTNVAGYNPSGVISASQFDLVLSGGGAPGLAAEPALVGKRVRFNSTTTTVALRNATSMIWANTASNITVANALPAVPVGTDVFYIEEPGVSVDNISVKSTMPNDQQAPTGFNLQGIQIAGIRTTNTGGGAAGSIQGPSICMLNFVDGASNAFTAYSINDFGDVRIVPTYVDETGTTITSGVGARAIGGVNANRGHFLLINTSAFVGPGATLGRIQVTTTLASTLGAGSYCFSGVLIQASGTGASGEGNVFGTNTIGRLNSTTAQRLRILAPTGSTTTGISMSFTDGHIYGVDITGMGASPCMAIRGTGSRIRIDDVVGTTGNTGAGLDLSLARDAHIAMGVLATNTFAGAAGSDILAFPGGATGPTYVHADYARTDLRDGGGNHIQGTAGSIVGPTTIASNDGNADIGQYKIVRPTASGVVRAAIASAAATAIACGVTQSASTAATAQQTMLVNGAGTWVQFDAGPTAGNIAYLSTATAGNAQDTIPAIVGVNQKLRLGRILRVSGTLGFIQFGSEILAVLANGLA